MMQPTESCTQLVREILAAVCVQYMNRLWVCSGAGKCEC